LHLIQDCQIVAKFSTFLILLSASLTTRLAARLDISCFALGYLATLFSLPGNFSSRLNIQKKPQQSPCLQDAREEDEAIEFNGSPSISSSIFFFCGRVIDLLVGPHQLSPVFLSLLCAHALCFVLMLRAFCS
jgi:hypothetical protein